MNRIGAELKFAPDCLSVFGRARELETQEGVTPNTVLRAFWTLDVPGSRLLSLCGLTREALETVLTDEANTPNTLGDLIYWACRADSGANREYICDSLDLAQQIVLRPWGRLAAYCKQHPVPSAVMQKALRELQSATGRLEADLLLLGSPLRGKPALARAKELRHLAQILTRTRVRSAAITGPAGCGKSSLLAGLAYQIESSTAPRSVQGVPMIRIDVDAVASIWQRGGKDALRRSSQAARDADAILVLDDLRDWEDNPRALGDLLELTAAELGVRVLTSADPAVYRRALDRNPSLMGRFEQLDLEPMDGDGCLEVVRGVREQLEQHYGLRATDEAVDKVAPLAKRYIHDRVAPASAIYLLDEAFSLAAMDAAEQLTLDHVHTVIQDRTGIPVRHTAERDARLLLNLETDISQRVIGQREAIVAVARTVRRSRAGLRDPGRPIGSFLFVGPSGVGKTELAKATAAVLFGSDQDLIAFDMSEYKEDTVWTLIGASRGYKMADQGGTLTEAVRKKPYSVLLFDEIEKAHPQVLDILLQVMEEGRLTDGIGRKVDFRNTLVIMTSNLAAQEVSRPGGELGFVLQADASLDGRPISEERLDAALRVALRPEFINRIDEIVAFNALTTSDLVAIAGLQLQAVGKRLEERGISVSATPAALRWLGERGHDRSYGARPLRRLIQERVADPAAELLLAGQLSEGQQLWVDVRGDDLIALPGESAVDQADPSPAPESDAPPPAAVSGPGHPEPPKPAGSDEAEPTA